MDLQRAVLGPSATLTGRERPAVDLCIMLTGISVRVPQSCLRVLVSMMITSFVMEEYLMIILGYILVFRYKTYVLGTR